MMQAGDGLVLRDLHASAAPPWWPPAPGWWLLAALALVLIAVAAWLGARRRRCRRALARMFDEALADVATPGERIAAISDLLRRAARRRDPQADRLQGEDWLRFLDRGLREPAFVAGAGRVLADGLYRRGLDQSEVEALCQLARARFLDWMGRR